MLIVLETEWLHASRAFTLTGIETFLYAFLAESVTAHSDDRVFEVLSAILAVCHSLSKLVS